MSRLTGQARVAQVGLARRKADKVKSRGMGVTIEGVQLWALIDTIDELRDELDAVDSSVMVERHEVELARVCADHKDELDRVAALGAAEWDGREMAHQVVLTDMATQLAAARAERDEARRALTVVPSGQPVVAEDAGNGKKPRQPRTKEEPWRSVCVAADEILRDELELWGQPLVEALTAWAEGNGRGEEVAGWVKTLEPVLTVPAVNA